MDELELLLRPVSIETFFRDHWDKKPLHIPGPPDKFAGLYEAENWHQRWMDKAKAATIDKQGVAVEVPIDPGQSRALFEAGMTICADVSDDPKLAPFLRGFRRGLDLPGGPAFARLYASNDGGGFAVHSDKFHVFVLQLAGKKRWRVSQTPIVPFPTEGARLDGEGHPVIWTGPAIGAPFVADGAPVAAPDVETFDSVLLEEGHCLYVPPGAWHVARAVGRSIAVSISPPRMPAAEFFCNVLQDLLLQRPEWRRDLMAAPRDQPPVGDLPRSVAATLDARLRELRELLGGMDERVFHRLWRHYVAAGQVQDQDNDSQDQVAEGLPQVSLRHADLLVQAGARPFHFLVAPSSDEREVIYIYAGESEWVFPMSARTFLAELSRHREFRVEAALAWDRSLSSDDAREILGRLIQAGVLARG